MNEPRASYRSDGRRFRAVIRYPDGHTRTANGRRQYYTATDARNAAQQVIDTEAEIYGDGIVYEPEYSDEQRG